MHTRRSRSSSLTTGKPAVFGHGVTVTSVPTQAQTLAWTVAVTAALSVMLILARCVSSMICTFSTMNETDFVL